MESNATLNTILIPVLIAIGSATTTLLVKGSWIAGIIGAIVTFALSYAYEVLP